MKCDEHMDLWEMLGKMKNILGVILLGLQRKVMEGIVFVAEAREQINFACQKQTLLKIVVNVVSS